MVDWHFGRNSLNRFSSRSRDSAILCRFSSRHRSAGRFIPVFSTVGATPPLSPCRKRSNPLIDGKNRRRTRKQVRHSSSCRLAVGSVQGVSDAELRQYLSLQVDRGGALNADGFRSKEGLFEGRHRADIRMGRASTHTNSQRDAGEIDI
jgi:hypothetical protein